MAKGARKNGDDRSSDGNGIGGATAAAADTGDLGAGPDDSSGGGTYLGGAGGDADTTPGGAVDSGGSALGGGGSSDETGGSGGAGGGGGGGAAGVGGDSPDSSSRRKRGRRSRAEIERDARILGEDVSRIAPPRRVKASSIEIEDDSTLNVASSTRALIEDGYQFLYWIPAKLTGIPDWNLDETEAKELAARTDAVIKSLGKRKAKKVIGAIDTYLPGFSLIAAAVIITAPRIKLTREVAARRVAKKPIQSPGSATGTTERTEIPTPAETGATSGGDVSADAWGSPRPLTAEFVEQVRERRDEQAI